ncbi:MAG: DUF3618 domain-containing protein [Rothia sp. (in: high G+C Gram-positive bacteria)]|nr:DUF3618 domain-containing protein [Rothia sp. (in: high G+C Gram-positive bacteria)]
MTHQSPEEIRAEIERTRARLGSDVDAVAEKINPESAVERQKAKARNKFQDIRESVMGVADSAGDTAYGVRESAADHLTESKQTLANAPQMAKAKTRGNPLGAGLIAVGAGLVIGSLLPTTRKEQELTAQAARKAQPHAQKAAQSLKADAQNIVEDLKEPAQQAAQSIKQTAQAGVEEVKQHGQYEAEDLKNSAASSAKNVKNVASNK